jgi:hypothetical protein
MVHHGERGLRFEQTDRYVNRVINWIMVALLAVVLLLALFLYLPV